MVLPSCSSASLELTEASAANRPAQTANRNPDISFAVLIFLNLGRKIRSAVAYPILYGACVYLITLYGRILIQSQVRDPDIVVR